MKRILFMIIAFMTMTTAMATEPQTSYSNVQERDTVIDFDVNPYERSDELQKIIEEQNKRERLQKIWSKRTFLNISKNSTKLSSKEFPSALGSFENEYKTDLGVGLQWGQTFDFHKDALGQVVFIGLDYSWLDLNFNSYKATDVPSEYQDDEKHDKLPWHNRKFTLDYGMSLGPSLTFYPFSSLNGSGANKIRFQLYFHVGYSMSGAMIKDVYKNSTETSTQFAFGHGLFTSVGFNLSWDFGGIGYEVRNDSNIKYKPTEKKYGDEALKFKQNTPRLYIQFRFGSNKKSSNNQ